MAIGIIPGNHQTFIIEGVLGTDLLEEGKLYLDEKEDRIYIYSTSMVRSNPSNGYFPIWNGNRKITSEFSNHKSSKDIISMNIKNMSSNVDETTAKRVLYQYRKFGNDEVLLPAIAEGDNMFTQCIKGVLTAKRMTLIDIVDSCVPAMDEKVIANYYIALNKITFMRLDRWNIWINNILHLRYIVDVLKNGESIITYEHPANKFTVGYNYDHIIKTKDDPFKKIVKILIDMENIEKQSLMSKEVDNYTINNMMTTINGSKSLSAQLFSRFLRMAKLTYTVQMFDNETLIFEYNE